MFGGEATGSYLDEGDPDGSASDVRLHLVTNVAYELVRDNKDQDLGSSHGLCQVRHCHLVENGWYNKLR